MFAESILKQKSVDSAEATWFTKKAAHQMTPVSKLEQMNAHKVTLPSLLRLGQLLKTY